MNEEMNLNEVSQNNGDNPQPTGNIGFSIASMICGIISIICCSAWYVAIILSIVAIVLGVISMKKNAAGRGMAIAGLITGGIGAVLCIIAAICAVALVSSGDSGMLYEQIMDSLDM